MVSNQQDPNPGHQQPNHHPHQHHQNRNQNIRPGRQKRIDDLNKKRIDKIILEIQKYQM